MAWRPSLLSLTPAERQHTGLGLTPAERLRQRDGVAPHRLLRTTLQTILVSCLTAVGAAPLGELAGNAEAQRIIVGMCRGSFEDLGDNPTVVFYSGAPLLLDDVRSVLNDPPEGVCVHNPRLNCHLLTVRTCTDEHYAAQRGRPLGARSRLNRTSASGSSGWSRRNRFYDAERRALVVDSVPETAERPQLWSKSGNYTVDGRSLLYRIKVGDVWLELCHTQIFRVDADIYNAALAGRKRARPADDGERPAKKPRRK